MMNKERAKVTGPNMTQLFPTALIALDCGAALMYALASDWRHMLYWLAAAVLTSTVTF